MSEYIIMTDSTVDLPKEYLIEELQVPYIPLSYIMDGVTYEDMSGLSGKEFFIKLMDDGEIPRLSSVRGSNFVHIGGYEIDDTGRLVMLSCIDNLVKGASGQAIQNMNILLGLEENAGLRHLGLHP